MKNQMRFEPGHRGAALLECSLLAALIAIVMVGAVTLADESVKTSFPEPAATLAVPNG